MPRVSAGLLMYRIHDGKLQVLLAHPGGPYFKNKDDGAWTIPKGEIEPGEDMLEAAKREFKEETGVTPSRGAGLLRYWASNAFLKSSKVSSSGFF